MFGVKISKIFNLKHSNRKMLKTKDPCSLQDFSARLAMVLFPISKLRLVWQLPAQTRQRKVTAREMKQINIFQRNRDEDMHGQRREAWKFLQKAKCESRGQID